MDPDDMWLELKIVQAAYSRFEIGCLANGERLTRQCRKLLWVIVGFTVAVE